MSKLNLNPMADWGYVNNSRFRFLSIKNQGGGDSPVPPEPVFPTDRILYTVVEGGHKPESTWITTNCSDNVFDAETGEGYLVLNEGVTAIDCPPDEEEEFYPNMFDDSGEDGNIATVVIPSQITRIGEDAFCGCYVLESAIIPDSVVSIGNAAFFNTALISVEIPSGVTSINADAFYNCTTLSSVTFNTALLSIGDCAFFGTALTSIEIPSGVTSIGAEAFSSCSSLTSAIIPNSVTSIGSSAFAGTALTSVEIPSGVTSIDTSTFASCTHLERVTLQSGLMSIGETAFVQCYSLTSVVIPSSVTSIGEEAFARCNSLASVECLAITPPTLGTNAFASIGTTECHVLARRIEAYHFFSNWSNYFTTFTAIQE